MIALPLLIAAALNTAAAAPICPSTPGSLLDRSEEAMAAWTEMDVPLFYLARQDGQEELSCLSTPMTPPAAGAYHRIEALSAYLNGDEAAASVRFQASALADPDWVFPEALAPEGNPLQLLYVSARSTPVAGERSAPPLTCAALSVDGQEGVIPDGLPAILQLSDHDTGAVLWTHYLEPDAAVPEWKSLEALSDRDCTLPMTPSQRRLTRRLLIGAGASALSAGALGLAARQSAAEFDAREYDSRDDGDALARRANNLLYGAQGAAALGLALGATSATLTLVW